jgi:hypothetical protein
MVLSGLRLCICVGNVGLVPSETFDADALTTDVLDRMVKATWIHHYTQTEGKGYFIAWTTHGGLTAMAFREFHKKLELGENDERPVILDMLAHHQSPNPASNSEFMNSTLKPYVTAGIATRARFIPNVGCDIEVTKFGDDFLKNFAIMTDALGISGDEDRLIVFFVIVACWAPDAEQSKN